MVLINRAQFSKENTRGQCTLQVGPLFLQIHTNLNSIKKDLYKSPSEASNLYLQQYFVQYHTIYSTRYTLRRLPLQYCCSALSPSQGLPSLLGIGCVQVRVRRRWLPAQIPGAHPLHWDHADQWPSTERAKSKKAILKYPRHTHKKRSLQHKYSVG